MNIFETHPNRAKDCNIKQVSNQHGMEKAVIYIPSDGLACFDSDDNSFIGLTTLRSNKNIDFSDGLKLASYEKLKTKIEMNQVCDLGVYNSLCNFLETFLAFVDDAEIDRTEFKEVVKELKLCNKSEEELDAVQVKYFEQEDVTDRESMQNYYAYKQV